MIDPKALEAAAIAFNRILLNQPDDCRDQPAAMQAAITAYLQAREQDGFVEVPKEPTEAMLHAGDMGLSNAGVDDSNTEDAVWCWRAMIASQAGKETP
jgi:hypothetical protein